MEHPNTSSDQPTETPADTTVDETADAGALHDADRPATEAEERIADRQAADVDPEVGEHYRDMTEIGANVKGEGQIVPD